MNFVLIDSTPSKPDNLPSASTPTGPVKSKPTFRPVPAKRFSVPPPATTTSTSQSGLPAETDRPVRAMKRKSPPELHPDMIAFFAEQRQFMQEAVGVMKETVTIARERNVLLRELTDALKKSEM